MGRIFSRQALQQTTETSMLLRPLNSQDFLLPFLISNQHSRHQQAITLSESEDEDSDEGDDGEEGQMLDEIFDAVKDDDANEEADDLEVK